MKKVVCVLYLVTAVWTGVVGAAMSYLDNGTVKIGVESSRGATITYFSQSGSTRNVINYADPGREVQQSYYSGPVPFSGGYYNSQPWPWNPVEAGDTNNHWSTVLSLTNDGTTLYTKVIPKQWALNNVDSECTMEKWITLSGNVAHVVCKMIVFRTDTTQQFTARHQELPAVYATADLYRIFTYNGSAPFTSASLTQMTASFPWTYTDATENWTACVDGTNWGLGIFTPGAQQTVLGFYGSYDTNPPSDPEDAATAYMAPLRTEIIDHNITYEYDFYLILDTLTNIRSYVYAHQPNKKPDYIFDTSRKGWYYKDGLTDTGFPINGYLRVQTTSSDPYMIGPETAWLGSTVPKIYIRARYNTTDTNAKIYWESFSGLGWFESQTKSFTVIADNQWHTYEVDLSSVSGYNSSRIRKLRFDPVGNGGAGQYVDIASITSYNPTQTPIITEVTPDPDTNAYAGLEYTKQLQVSGSTPITWSLLQGPGGMQINSGTGYVSGWTPTACDAGVAKTIQVQAQNSAGSDTETWQVTAQDYYLTDSVVNLSDLLVMVNEWLQGGSSLITDLDCSSSVNLADFADLSSVWLQEPALTITNISPAYTIKYDSLAVGQTVYLDRSYKYNNSIPSAYQNKTFIQTNNADKYSTGDSFLTFTINRNCTVYVVHDDTITTKPTWMSSFVDTGDNITSDNPETYSVYKKDFSAGIVTLGGNGGGVSSSMYSVVVVPVGLQ